MPNSDPCQIITPLVLVGLGLGVGEGLGLGVGLGLGNHIAISRRGVIIWQGVENGHNTGMKRSYVLVHQTAADPHRLNRTLLETLVLLSEFIQGVVTVFNS